MSSSIIFLPLRLKRPPVNESTSQERKPLVLNASVVQGKLTALRSKRVAIFFRAKARQRFGAQTLALMGGSTTGAVTAMLRSLRRLTARFFSQQRAAMATLIDQRNWKKCFRPLPSIRGERSLLGVIRRTIGRALASLTMRKEARAEREHPRQIRLYQYVSRALARLGQSAIAAAHKRYKIEGAARLAQKFVGELMEELTRKVVAAQEQARVVNHACLIQRLWRRWKRNDQTDLEAKSRLLKLLAGMNSCLELREQTQQKILKAVQETTTRATALFVHRATQRLGARLIQRVWRGHCARQRARRLRDLKLKKLVKRRQRERLREARGALLAPSEMEKRRRRELEARVIARQKETPLLPLPRRNETHHQQGKRGDRATLLEPLPLQTRPPRVSALTRTKVQCIPFSRFERIVAQEACVNLNNVWVAIPVAHYEKKEDNVPPNDGLSPVLVGKGRRQNVKEGLRTAYDWVPARLLQSKAAREASASRRRPRAVSPSAARRILTPADHLPRTKTR